MKVVNVAENNIDVYLNLAQCYEGEFSKITKKPPNSNGIYELDTHINNKNIKGFLAYIDETPIGLAAISICQDNSFEMCEFYITPYHRKKQMGKHFAHEIWQSYPGKWVVKQIVGAEYASQFWRKVIPEIRPCYFEEDRYEDRYWGVVTRQQFSNSEL